MEANKHDNDEILNNATSGEYKYGFTSDIDTHIIPCRTTILTSHLKKLPFVFFCLTAVL